MNGLALALDELRALALSPKLAWRQFAPGVSIHRLWGEPNTRSGALLRYAPGGKIRAAPPRGDREHLRAHRRPARRARRIRGRRARRQPARIGPRGLQPGGLRRVRGLGASQHVPRRVALTWRVGTWQRGLGRLALDRLRVRAGERRDAPRPARAPRAAGRAAAVPARGPGRLPRLPAAPAGRAGRRRRADDRRRGRTRARTRW